MPFPPGTEAGGAGKNPANAGTVCATIFQPASMPLSIKIFSQAKESGGRAETGCRRKAQKKRRLRICIHKQRQLGPLRSLFSPCTKRQTGGIIRIAMCREFGCVWRDFFSVCRRQVVSAPASALHFFVPTSKLYRFYSHSQVKMQSGHKCGTIPPAKSRLAVGTFPLVCHD